MFLEMEACRNLFIVFGVVSAILYVVTGKFAVSLIEHAFTTFVDLGHGKCGLFIAIAACAVVMAKYGLTDSQPIMFNAICFFGVAWIGIGLAEFIFVRFPVRLIEKIILLDRQGGYVQ